MKLPLVYTLEYKACVLSKKEAKFLYKDLIESHGIADSRIRVEVKNELHYSDFGKIMVIDQDLCEANRFPSSIYGKAIT